MAETANIQPLESFDLYAVRSEYQLLPTFSSECEEIRKNGLTMSLLYDILRKHSANSMYNRKLYERYMGIKEGVPILNRHPIYEEERKINNRINNDFVGLIVNAKVGCFAGNPTAYSYSDTTEAENVTGGESEVEKTKKALSDFIVRNTMHKIDSDITKKAAIYGYSGRLLYIKDGVERVRSVHGYETIIFSDTDITEPEYAIRYFKSYDIQQREYWTVEFYDDRNVTIYQGNSLYSLEQKEQKEHLFAFCPLQGVPNNEECMGDTEKVLALIDEYDKTISDNANELESFVHAMLLVTILGDRKTVAEQLQKANATGTMHITPTGTTQVNEPVKWLTKQINDTFVQHHLETIRDNIHIFSQTPNFNDESFGSASGIALEHKFNGMREKCTTFKASKEQADMYMWKVLASSFAKRGIILDPLQVVAEYNLNIPQDVESEAKVVQMLLGAGLPKRYAFSKLSDVEDVEYLMQLLIEEKEDEQSTIPFYTDKDDDIDDNDTDINKATNANIDEKDKNAQNNE